MPACQVALAAAILLGGAMAQAGAAPLIPLPLRAFLQSKEGVEVVRWRHRHYRDFWSGRGDGAERGDSDSSSPSSTMRSLNSAAPPTGSEIFGPQFRRRGGWVDPPPPR